MVPLFALQLDATESVRRRLWLRRAVGLFGLLLVGATWPLWTPQTVFPQVPLVGGEWLPGPWAEWALAAAMLAGLAAMLVLPQGRPATIACGLFAVAAALAMLFDQQRMQPWAYQFLLFAIVLATCPPRSATLFLKLLVIAFYFESALTKFDYSFLHTLGQQFLATLSGLVGLNPEDWSPGARLAAAAVFPLGEMLVAVGLLRRPTRQAALVGAVTLHLLLLAILGPWGLAHRPGVLLWNLYFIVQDLILFWPRQTTAAVAAGGELPPERTPWPVLTLVLAVVALPLAEPWGLFDLWPSWGLYASSAERVTLEVHRLDRERLPEELAPFVEEPADPLDPWLNVRLDRWALASLGAPIYPQARVQLGVALAVAEGAALADRTRIVRAGRADRWSGERNVEVLTSAADAHRAAGDHLLNALPRRAFKP